jgi:hypothetical protein
METSAVGVRWFVDKRASLYLGRRTIHDDSAIITGRFDFRLSDKWGVGIEHQEDTRKNKGLRTTLSLFRRAHDYTIALEMTADPQSEQRGVAFAIYPNDWLGGHDDPFRMKRPLDYDAQRWYR